MIYIVIPVYNRINFTRKCLESLRSQTLKDFKIIVVDDCSTDETVDVITREYPEVILLQSGGELFWTATVNIGIRYALSEGGLYVMTLNNDTILPDDFLDKMLKSASVAHDAIIGAVEIDYYTNKVHYGGECLKWWMISPDFYHEVLPKESRNGLHVVEYYPARGLLMPSIVFQRIGLFDEKYFPHYYADYEFTKRASVNGIKVYANWDVSIITFPDASGDSQNRNKKTLKNYYNHLFGIKGGGNLKNFTIFTLRYQSIFLILIVLIKGYLQRIVGYWIK